MAESERATGSDWVDPDGAPELTDEMLDVAALAVGSKVIRPATGYLGPNGVVRGSPPLCERAKSQVTLRLDPDVLVKFREGGRGGRGGSQSVAENGTTAVSGATFTCIRT
ncbi:BrnA antitoxin family protein [Sphingomonas mollis]|uniref:BrnA antitoxin family protein n=1 Tax=Sphingomonas mollis TaxID=2795726 RepID=A0ABS0XMV1_9SPHN|nr:BrnA antitoxin family protein [Sphingomonas sp. BT553]MBJ6121354.1 BrnA antitoxin family protein [Sphingomonas sp. BT553]